VKSVFAPSVPLESKVSHADESLLYIWKVTMLADGATLDCPSQVAEIVYELSEAVFRILNTDMGMLDPVEVAVSRIESLAMTAAYPVASR